MWDVCLQGISYISIYVCLVYVYIPKNADVDVLHEGPSLSLSNINIYGYIHMFISYEKYS